MAEAKAAAMHVAVVTAPKSMPVSDVEHPAREHQRLDDDDVGHRQERRQAGQQFRSDGSVVFREAEESVEHGGHSVHADMRTVLTSFSIQFQVGRRQARLAPRRQTS